jgi:hypothetical protein
VGGTIGAALKLQEVIEEMARRAAKTRSTRWSPETPTPRQQAFLDLEETSFYGGAAGGGKSSALLLDALKGVDTPGYVGLILRRTFAQLALPGAIMDRLGDWLRPTAATWRDETKTWTFPSGAKIVFGYYEHERHRDRYQGPEFTRVYFDELTQFQERQFRYLFSRIRAKEGFPLKTYIKGAANPGGVGHRWVYRLFVDPETAAHRFVPAKISDNPHIDQAAYLANLEHLDATTKAQLRDGLWIEDQQGLVYPFEACDIIDSLPEMGDVWEYLLAIDLGARVDVPTTSFTVIGWPTIQLGETVYVLESYKEAAMTPHSVAEEALALAKRYRGFEGGMVMDEGALGKGYGEEMRIRHNLPVRPAKKSDKLGHRRLLRGAMERHSVKVYARHCADLLDEAAELRWNEDGTDNVKGASNHCTDGLLYGYRQARAFRADAPPPVVTDAAEAQRLFNDKVWRQRLAEEQRGAKPWYRR